MVKDVKETMDVQTEIMDCFDDLVFFLEELRCAEGLHDFERDTVSSVINMSMELRELIYSLGFLVEVKEDLNRYEGAE